jgi:hypothetical protein
VVAEVKAGPSGAVHLTRHHATAFLSPRSSQKVEELRRTWDPAMAQQIAAHITLIYPEEIADPAELIVQATRAAASTAPFSITVGAPIHAGHPADGVYGERAWNELAGLHIDARFTITEVAITAYDGQRWPALQTIPLTSRQLGMPGQESVT